LNSVQVERTFVIADLAGFAATTEAHGDKAAADLADQLVSMARGVLGPRDEFVKSIGDAVLCACLDAEAGVRFAHSLLDSVAGPGDLPLLRVGAHHGSAEERNRDYFGTAVNVAARVANLAAGCQVLATAEVADAARALGVGVVGLGPYQLRNITAPVEIFEIDCGHDSRGHTIDPVCRMRVDRDRAAGTLRHGDAEYWFCSLECAARFATSPAAYTD